MAINTTHNIVYKTLGFKWLISKFCPALAFVSADRNEARNPQRFTHAGRYSQLLFFCLRVLLITLPVPFRKTLN